MLSHALKLLPPKSSIFPLLSSSGQDLIDSWIHKKTVDDLLKECDIQDEVSSTSLTGYNKELSHHHQDSSSLFDSSPNNYEEDEVRKPGNS